MALFGPPNVQKMKDKKDFEGLIKALDYQKDRYVRRDAALALAELHDAQTVEPLISLLKMKYEDQVRKAAAQALGLIGDSRAVDTLITILNPKNVTVTEAAACALGQIGDARGVEPLIRLLGEERSDLRDSSAQALGQIGQPAVKPLIAVLQGDNLEARKSAAAALDELHWDPDKTELVAWYYVAKQEWEKASGFGEAAVGPLMATFRLKGILIPAGVATALGKIGLPAVESLIEEFKEKPTSEGARALGMIDDPRVEEALIPALSDTYEDVCLFAAYGLSQIGGQRAVEPLIAALRDKRLRVRKSAGTALVNLYKKVALPEKINRRILSVRDMITSSHSDRLDTCTRVHTDSESGVEVDFPL